RHRPAAPAALATQPAVEGVDGGGPHARDRLRAERGQQLLVDVAPVVGQRVGGDRADALTPLQPRSDQLGHSLAGRAPVLAGADLTDQPGFELARLGLGPGGPGLLPLAPGEGVTTGVDDDPPTVAALLDHPVPALGSPC